MTDEELFWPGKFGDSNDWDDDALQGDGLTTTVGGGIGLTPEQASVVPSFNARRKKRRSASIAVTKDPKESGGFQNSMKVV